MYKYMYTYMYVYVCIYSEVGRARLCYSKCKVICCDICIYVHIKVGAKRPTNMGKETY